MSGTVGVLRRWKSPRGLQVPSGLGTIRRGLDHGEEEHRTIPTFSILRNSALADASFSGSKRQALGKTGGPGAVGRSCKTPYLGVEAKNCKKRGRQDTPTGVSGFLWEPAVDVRKTDRRQLEKTSRESASETLALATSTNKP